MVEEYSRLVAEFVSEFDPRNIAPGAIERSRQSVLNGTAAALSACRAEPVELLIGVLTANGQGGESRLFGRSERLDLLNSVMANGYMGHYNDYDDTHTGTVYHTNPSNLPALLGLGANRHANGQDAVHSLALGMEASIRIGQSLGRVHYESGWHITGTMGAVGVALTCSRLLKLDAQRTNMALGLALTQSAGLRGLMFGSMAKGFNASKAAYNGLLAALLAEKGFTAAPNAIEGGRGFASAASRAPEVDFTRITDGLGSRWEVERIGFKPYASGAATHATIDAILALRRELGLDEHSTPEQVDQAVRQLEVLNLTIPEHSLTLPRGRDIDTALEAKFSMYNVAAIVLVRGRAGPGEYNEAVLTDPAIDFLRHMIDLTGDPKTESGAGALHAQLKDGRTIDVTIDHATGTIYKPMSDADLRRKLFDAAEGVLPRDRTEALASALEGVQTLDDLARIMELASI